MKKLLFLIFVCSFSLNAQFVDFTESSGIKKNKFLGLDMSMCKVTTDNSKTNYQKAYDCGNGSVSTLLNVNLLSPGSLGQDFYIFNNFMYWLSGLNMMGAWNGKDAAAAKQAALADQNPDAYFSGSGVFMIVVGSSSYLQQIVAPTVVCPAGQTLLCAQLKYNDGHSIVNWSQDSICLAPTDTFTIQVSDDQDNSVSATQNLTDAQGINWMKDAGPSANYAQAGGSPRKVRFVKSSTSSAAA